MRGRLPSQCGGRSSALYVRCLCLCLLSTTLDSSIKSRSLAVWEVVLKVSPYPKSRFQIIVVEAHSWPWQNISAQNIIKVHFLSYSLRGMRSYKTYFSFCINRYRITKRNSHRKYISPPKWLIRPEATRRILWPGKRRTWERGKDRYVAWGDSSFWSLEKYER